MSDFRDVMTARNEAQDARRSMGALGASSTQTLALLLVAEAICAEIRALQVMLDHARGDAS